MAAGFAIVFDLGAGWGLAAVLMGGLTVGLTLTTGLLLAAALAAGFATVFAVGLVAGLALTADLATDFTTGFLGATDMDDFTTALPEADLATGLAAALLAGLALVALDWAATVLALVDTGVFPVLIVKSCLFAA